MALDGRIDPKKASGLNIEFECRAGAFSTLGYDAIGIVDALWTREFQSIPEFIIVLLSGDDGIHNICSRRTSTMDGCVGGNRGCLDRTSQEEHRFSPIAAKEKFREKSQCTCVRH